MHAFKPFLEAVFEGIHRAFEVEGSGHLLHPSVLLGEVKTCDSILDENFHLPHPGCSTTWQEQKDYRATSD